MHNLKLLIAMFNLSSGASANVEGLTTNLASLKLGLHNRDGAPQLMKLLDENLQWSDTALEVQYIYMKLIKCLRISLKCTYLFY